MLVGWSKGKCITSILSILKVKEKINIGVKLCQYQRLGHIPKNASTLFAVLFPLNELGPGRS